MARTDDARKEITDLLRAFVPRDVACTAAGVEIAQFEEWLETGRAARTGKLRQFARDVDQLEAKAEAQLIARMASASQAGDTKATQWLLERGRPERWARRSVGRPASPAAGAVRPPAAGEGEGTGWSLNNVKPLRRTG